MMTNEVTSCKQQLEQFAPISLMELDRVALLDRMDTKYAFTADQLPFFLNKLSSDYRILEIDNNRMFHYNSLYFDTQNFDLFNAHYCGKLNRYKVRFRRYVESNLGFFEIKFKTNKGRTIKSRIKHNSSNEITGDAMSLLKSHSPLAHSGLDAKFWVNYTRITLVSSDLKERLTFDLDLTFKNDQEEKTIHNIVIAELKQSKAGKSVFSKLMKQYHVRVGTIRKYCFGVVSLFKNIRANNFKPHIHNINKIIDASTAGY